jgi:soluble lytic murein transglycosylase-like protein
MKFFAPMLFLILMLAAGFAAGVKYQERADARGKAAELIEIQKSRIAHLQHETVRLRTALTLRDYLEEVRVRLPRATYQEMVEAIADASRRYDVPPETILAVIRIESAFDPEAVSEAGAVGLMQVLPSTAEELARELRMPFSEETLRDPSSNIALGTFYLTKMLGRFDDLALALAAYNAGPGRVVPGAPPINDYSARVLAYANP